MKILYIGDLHVGSDSFENEQAICRRLLDRAAEADLVVLGGDLTNIGLPGQYDRLIELYAPLGAKCVPVRGNHDMGDFMRRMKPWLPAGAAPRFEPADYPVWIWTTDWFEMLASNTRCFAVQQRLPEPYNRLAQPPVIVVQDGIGPYYAFEREGFRFIVLDASTHRLGAAQQAWLADEIAASRLPVIILMHHNILPAGSRYDAAMLWDRRPVLDHLIDDPRVLGVFSGHVHYNRIWDWHGKKIVTTAERGDSRFIELIDGKIASIEPVDNARCNGRFRDRDSGQSEEQPLDLRYWWADGVLTPTTFWCFSDDLWLGRNNWGWHDPDGPGGLTWSVPPALMPHRETWFGVNFRSTTPWEVVIEKDGAAEVVGRGGPTDNQVVTASFGRDEHRSCRVILKQQAPACGHASGYLALDCAPVQTLMRYP